MHCRVWLGSSTGAEVSATTEPWEYADCNTQFRKLSEFVFSKHAQDIQTSTAHLRKGQMYTHNETLNINLAICKKIVMTF